MVKIFPDLYDDAGKPRFEIQDVIGGKNNIYGQAQKAVTGKPGNYRVVSKGVILIKKLSMNLIRDVASVAGHELNHMIDYVTGDYQNWANMNGLNGLHAAHVHSEIKAYDWGFSMQATLYDGDEYWKYKTNQLFNTWKF